LGRLSKQNAHLEEDSARDFDFQRQQVSVCAQEVQTEQASVRVQEEADETDCPKISSGLNDLPTWMEVQKAHKEWVCDGRLINYDENPKLNRKSAHAIVRFLLPRVDIKGELKMKDLTQ